MARKLKTALALSAAPAAPIGHNSADAPHTDAPHTDAPHTDAPHTDAPHTDAPHTDAVTVEALKAFSGLVATGIRNKHAQNEAIRAMLGTNPSTRAKELVRVTFMRSHIATNAKCTGDSVNARWIEKVLSDPKFRDADPDAKRAYNAGKSAWSLRLADLGLTSAKNTKEKNAGKGGAGNPSKGQQEERSDNDGANPSGIVSRAEAMQHIHGQMNSLLLYARKQGVADAVLVAIERCLNVVSGKDAK